MRSQHQNQHGRGYGMEDDSSHYGHGDTDEESVDDTEQNTGDEMDEDDGSEYGHGDTDEESVDDSEHSGTEEFDGKVDYDMDSENGDIVDSEGSDEESMDDSEQSEDMNDDEEMDNEIVNSAPTSVFKSINTPTYPCRILKKGTKAPNKVYVYADGRVRCSGEDVNVNEIKFTHGTRDYEFPPGKGIGGLLRAIFS